MGNRAWLSALIVLVIIGIAIVFLMPTYKFQYVKLGACDEVTIIEYKSFSDRGIVFTEGHQTNRDFPENGWYYSGLSGFDTMFDVIVTCEQQKAKINFYEGQLQKLGNPNTLQSKLLSSTEYSSLKKDNQGKSFRFY